MSTHQPTPVPPDILADLEATARYAATGQADPEALRRIGERATKARAELERKVGVQEISVQIIREMRDA
jgi:hypothetical protein